MPPLISVRWAIAPPLRGNGRGWACGQRRRDTCEQPRRRGVQGFCTTVRYASTGCPIAGTRRPDPRDPRQPRGAQADSAPRQHHPAASERRAARWRPPMDPRSRRPASRRRTAGVRALDGLDVRRRAPARSSACSARTAPASRRRSRSSRRSPARQRQRAGRRHRRARRPGRVRRAIGVVGQKPSFDPDATGRENLVLQGQLYGVTGGELKRASTELLERFGLADAADRPAKTYSGGMQRRLDVALGLVHRPAGAVPRRADDRPRPRGARRDVGGDRAASRGEER